MSNIWERGDRMPDRFETDTKVQIEWHGPVGGSEPDPDVWKGSASAKEFDFGDRSMEYYKGLLREYYRTATPGGPVRCVEKRYSGIVGVLYDQVQGIQPSNELLAQVFLRENGRFSSSQFRGSDGLAVISELARHIRNGVDITEHPAFALLRQEVESEPLGPQTVGGTHAMAYSYRIAKGIEVGATLQRDIEFLAQVEDTYQGNNHKDERAVPPKIGCTAVDQGKLILYRAASALVRPDNERISRFLLGHSPDPMLEREVLLGFDQHNNPEFQDIYNGDDPRQTGLDALEKAHGSEIEIVAGGFEGAVFFIVSREDGQTFHKNLWGLDIMAKGIPTPPGTYNYDLWRSIERSKTLFPDDELGQRRFMKARCLYAASTLTVLCDGTLELGEIKKAA
jgi:hypothetical protein